MVRIAVAGKGGVGKTLVAAGIAWSLAKAGIMTIAIDADPSPNLAIMLGLSRQEADAIVPVSQNESLIRAKTATPYPGVYNLQFSVDDIVRNYAVQTPAGIPLLVMGTIRQMGAGCSCPANTLVKNLLHHLVTERSEAVVLDMEAGVEHMGRGTAKSVDVMVVVSTADSRALATAGSIARMAVEAGIPRVMFAGNRIEDPVQEDLVRQYAKDNNIDILGIIPSDPTVAAAGIRGEPILSLYDSEAVHVIQTMTDTLAGMIRPPVRKKQKNRD